MSDVAEHDSEKEGEGDEVEDSRVDLLVLWHSIGREDGVGSICG